MTHTITVRHNAEMAHRLPHLPGKCQSLHGHSWWFEVEIAAPFAWDTGLCGLEFGEVKGVVRGWIDTHLDHGVALGQDDPLVPILREHGCKVHVVPNWPTVEVMAATVAEQVDAWLESRYPSAAVIRVNAQETHVNAATWRRR